MSVGGVRGRKDSQSGGSLVFNIIGAARGKSCLEQITKTAGCM